MIELIIEYNETQEKFSFDGETKTVIIGRSGQCDIKLDDPSISKTHCQITILEDMITIKDLSSTNGTLLNGSYIAEFRLLLEDIVTVGETKIFLSRENMTPTERGLCASFHRTGPKKKVRIIDPK